MAKPNSTTNLRTRTGVKAGGGHGSLTSNANQAIVGVRTRTGVKGGGVNLNANQTAAGVRTRTGIKAGSSLGISLNANQTVGSRKKARRKK
jgi:hypothetical protein